MFPERVRCEDSVAIICPCVCKGVVAEAVVDTRAVEIEPGSPIAEPVIVSFSNSLIVKESAIIEAIDLNNTEDFIFVHVFDTLG